LSRYFSQSYKEARDAFLSAARARSAAISSYRHGENGPNGEQLFVDIARLGDPLSKRILIIISGTHGVEGFCGSACQTAWLSQTNGFPNQNLAVYLIHSLNPYGFAWCRRVTQDNVDLNRNFLDFKSSPVPENREYRELEILLNPREMDQSHLGKLDPRLRQWFATEDGQRKLKAAVGKGQYEFSKGIIFGGTSATWNHVLIRRFIDSLPMLQVGIVLDLHTGLGEAGELEIFTEETLSKFQRIAKWFEGWRVTTLGGRDSLGYKISGSLYQAFTAADTDSPWHCVALEFGTQSLMNVLLALQADNWLYCFTDGKHPLSSRIQTLMKDAFLISTNEWQDRVVNTALGVIKNSTTALSCHAQS
jgi:hypothetical protein